jgi:hypothetical protein
MVPLAQCTCFRSGQGDAHKIISFQEQRECQYKLEADGFTIDRVGERVVSILGINCEQVWEKGKHPQTVKSRSLLCYRAVRELGINAAELARRIGISQQDISQSVKWGEVFVKENGYELMNS